MLHQLAVCTVFLTFAAISSNVDARSLKNVGALTGNPEALMTAPQIIRYYNYPVELHDVVTEDGYVLEMHRIPYGLNSTNSSDARRPPVLIIHGLTCSSACLIMNPPDESLPFIMAEAGFDVWLANNRGNSYSTRHINMSVDSDAFWAFTWDEMGYYDLPAMIDYMLNVTGEQQIVVSGHSQGGTIIYAGLSRRPEYQAKVKLIVGLAPVVYFSNMRSPFLQFLQHFAPEITDFEEHFGTRRFTPKDEETKLFATLFCANGRIAPLCENFMFLLTGYDSAGFNQSRIDVYLAQHEGTSTRDLIHYVQASRTQEFQRYDYGNWGDNWRHYESLTPPRYTIENIVTPSAIYYSGNDYLADIADLDKLRQQLPNVTEFFLVANSEFQHLDFMMSWEARQYVYDPMVAYIKQNFW